MSIGQEITFTVPHLTPPSVNHYKQPCRFRNPATGRMRLGMKLTAEAKAYTAAVCLFARGETLIPVGLTKYAMRQLLYGCNVKIYLGPGVRLDADNGGKLVLDSLQKARVIHSDAFVREFKAEVIKDQRDNPRTEITVWRIR
jgi:Holliday junction resolvase RusA-like endonuclease